MRDGREVSRELADEFPNLWAASVRVDERERLGRTYQDPLEEEASRAMHLLWLVRVNSTPVGVSGEDTKP